MITYYGRNHRKGQALIGNKVTIYTIAGELNMSVSMASRAFKTESKLNLKTSEKMGFVRNKMASRPVEEAFRTFPDIDGIYVSSANSTPICKYLEEHNPGDKVAVIASDVFPELSGYMRKGVVNATVYQDPFHQGSHAFEGLFYHIAEGRSINSIIMTDPQIVIRSNLSAYER